MVLNVICTFFICYNYLYHFSLYILDEKIGPKCHQNRMLVSHFCGFWGFWQCVSLRQDAATQKFNSFHAIRKHKTSKSKTCHTYFSCDSRIYFLISKFHVFDIVHCTCQRNLISFFLGLYQYMFFIIWSIITSFIVK